MARPVVDKVLAPVMIGGALGEGEWPLAIRFDIMQRSCRAAFALYFVVKAAKIVLSGQLLRKQDDQGRPTALVEQHDIWAAATPESQRLIGQFLGFMLADTLDLFTFFCKHSVLQSDILIHHILGLVFYGRSWLRRRGHVMASELLICELLVPCGVLLWWLRALGKPNSKALNAVQILGLLVLLLCRLPILLNILRRIWIDDGTCESSDNNLVRRRDHKTFPWRLNKHCLSAESICHSLATLFALGLDQFWCRLYLQGLMSKS